MPARFTLELAWLLPEALCGCLVSGCLPWGFCHLGTLVLHSGRRRCKGKRVGLIPPVTHLHPAALRRAWA